MYLCTARVCVCVMCAHTYDQPGVNQTAIVEYVVDARAVVHFLFVIMSKQYEIVVG
jgi:hypothetical protein